MDKNLKYLVIESLVSSVRDKDIRDAVSAIETSSFHEEYHEEESRYNYYQPIPEIAQAYDRISLTQEQLDKVTFLSGECCSVHFDIIPGWDGEGWAFNMQSLDGLELLKNLKKMEFIGFEEVSDISALLQHPSVEALAEYSGLSRETRDALEQKGIKLL